MTSRLKLNPQSMRIVSTSVADAVDEQERRQGSTYISRPPLDKGSQEHSLVSLSHVKTNALLSIDELGDDEAVDELFVETEIERAYKTAVTTIMSIWENEEGNTIKQDLLKYVNEVFDVGFVNSGITNFELIKEATQADIKVDEWKVTIYVLRGTNLEAKDKKGLTGPYIMFGVIPSSNQEDHIVRTSNLSDWMKEGLVLGNIETTVRSVETETLNPEWNEEVELKIRSVESQVLVIEVWDRDKTNGDSAKIKEHSTKGLFSFLHHSTKNDFIGRSFYPLDKIAAGGEEREVELLSHSKKSKHGTVTLQLNIIESVTKGVTSEEHGLDDHMVLMRELMNAENRNEHGRYTRNWDGTLSLSALKLLYQHFILSEINELERVAIEFSLVLHYHRNFGVRITKFLSLVKEIKEKYSSVKETKASTRDIIDGSDLVTTDVVETLWESNLYDDLKELLDSVLTVLKKHLTKIQVYNGGEEKRKLDTYIQVAEELSTFQPLTEHLDDAKRNIARLVYNTIPLAVTDWFSSFPLIPPKCDKALDQLENMCDLSLEMSNIALYTIMPIFNRAPLSLDYFTSFYVALDKLLSDRAETVVSVYSDLFIDKEQEGNTDKIVEMFSIYLYLNRVKALSSHLNPSLESQSVLYLSQLSSWFENLVPFWIKEAARRCDKQVDLAIQLDKVVKVTSEVKISSSAVDATGFLFQLLKLRDDLQWPEPLNRMMFSVSILQEVMRCATSYIDKAFESLKDEYIYDSDGKFRATEKLSIILNNVCHLSQQLLLRTDLFPELNEEERTVEHIVQVHSRVTETIKGIMEKFSDAIDKKMSMIIKQILDKVRPAVESYLLQVVDVKGERGVVIPEPCSLDYPGPLAPLLDYLTSNLQTLGDYLLLPVFNNILGNMWKAVLETVDILSRSIAHKEPANYHEVYERLYCSLEVLKMFFYADGQGLSVEALENELYHSLISELEVFRLTTKKLQLRFLSDLVKKKRENTIGSVLFTVGYLTEERVVDVNILQAMDLSASVNIDKWYFSCVRPLISKINPFIEVSLVPHWMFENSSTKIYRAKGLKDRTNAIYSFQQSWQLPASEEMLKVEGASLLLSVYNDTLFDKLFSGLCIIPCKDIPVIDSSGPVIGTPTEAVDNTDGNVSGAENDQHLERANFNLPLIDLHSDNSLVLTHIMERAKQRDKSAMEFLERNTFFVE